MEVFELLDLCGCFLELVSTTSIIADIAAWIHSRPNRIARKEAKMAGEIPPEPDGWTTAFQILTPMAITLAVLVILKWLRKI
ncbi:MAG: hypothetical protein U0746_13305 [Gemmataceae bacterium]